MTYTGSETPQALPPSPEQTIEQTQMELAKAKLQNFLKLPPLEMIQNYLQERQKLSPEQRREWLKAMVFSLVFLKLGMKPKEAPSGQQGSAPADNSQAAANTEPTETSQNTPQKPEGSQSSAPARTTPSTNLPSVDLGKYKKGDLVTAIAGLYPGVEVQGQAEPQQTSVSKRNGVPKWGRNTTDNWDYTKAGNTDEGIEKGEYQIQAVREPASYTRQGAEQVPEGTQKKLVRIAELLRADPRMPLFTGIAMTVDGVQVMFVKEIHIHSMSEYGKRGLRDYYYQPHTGVSYVMKRT